jgi:hypothetical protein
MTVSATSCIHRESMAGDRIGGRVVFGCRLLGASCIAAAPREGIGVDVLARAGVVVCTSCSVRTPAVPRDRPMRVPRPDIAMDPRPPGPMGRVGRRMLAALRDPCRHMGARLDRPTCGCVVLACALHGRCEQLRAMTEARCCLDCGDYVGRVSGRSLDGIVASGPGADEPGQGEPDQVR